MVCRGRGSNAGLGAGSPCCSRGRKGCKVASRLEPPAAPMGWKVSCGCGSGAGSGLGSATGVGSGAMTGSAIGWNAGWKAGSGVAFAWVKGLAKGSKASPDWGAT